jgi:hypothetical protein
LRFKKQGMGEFSLVPRRDLIQRTHRMPSWVIYTVKYVSRCTTGLNW